MFELSGTIKEVFEEQTFASGFNKRDFVVTTEDEKYPQDIKFECLKDKVSLVDGLNKGDRVTVSFDVRGREWKGNYFVNLAAWKIEKDGTNPEKGASEKSDEPPPFDPDDEILDEEPPF